MQILTDQGKSILLRFLDKFANEILPRIFSSIILVAVLSLVFSKHGEPLGVPNLFRDVDGVHTAVFQWSTLTSPTAWAHALMFFSAGLASLLPLFDWFYGKNGDDTRVKIASWLPWVILIVASFTIYVWFALVWTNADSSELLPGEIGRAAVGAVVGVVGFWIALFLALLWVNMAEASPVPELPVTKAAPNQPHLQDKSPLAAAFEWLSQNGFAFLTWALLRVAHATGSIPRAVRSLLGQITDAPRDLALSLFFLPLVLVLIIVLALDRLLPGVALVALILLIYLIVRWLLSISGTPRLVALVAIFGVFFVAYGGTSPDKFKLTFDGIVGPQGDLYDVPLNDLYDIANGGAGTKNANERPTFGDCSASERAYGAGVDFKTSMNNWLAHAKDIQGVEKPKLVVVATSGGAYRASFWTAMVLDELNSQDAQGPLKGLSGSIRFITGASGGMVAGAYQAALAQRGGWPTEDGKPISIVHELSRDIDLAQGMDVPALGQSEAAPVRFSRDSLSDVARQLIRDDLPSLFQSGRADMDRGKVLEQHWRTVHRPFALFQGGERDGWRPSILFSPMLIESGKQLVISNLDLSRAPPVSESEMVDFFGVYPCARGYFSMATAVRMSASFPYIAPAVSLPAQPPQRVVDAGYYDNYGIALLKVLLTSGDKNCEGDFCLARWLRTKTSGIVLIEIRAFDLGTTSEGTGHCGPPASHKKDAGKNDDTGGPWEFLTSPIEALLVARGKAMIYRNEQALRQYMNSKGSIPIHRIVLNNCLDAGMNWTLPKDEFDDMKQHFDDLWKCQKQFQHTAEGPFLTAQEWLVEAWNTRTSPLKAGLAEGSLCPIDK